uniref:Uncharacterized protein n=1 Tax=Anguilla anguilla TaxID=7936 RepID=A0A0E9VB29_ANGAN
MLCHKSRSDGICISSILLQHCTHFPEASVFVYSDLSRLNKIQ